VTNESCHAKTRRRPIFLAFIENVAPMDLPIGPRPEDRSVDVAYGSWLCENVETWDMSARRDPQSGPWKSNWRKIC
jgi:hypothetical protein